MPQREPEDDRTNSTAHTGFRSLGDCARHRRVRLIVNRAYGFHSANAALGLIMLTLGPIEHVLPHERRRDSDP